jgi:PAS domain S-box-containing protein
MTQEQQIGRIFNSTFEAAIAAEGLRELVRTLAAGVTVQDPEGRLVATNPAAEELFGTTLEQMRGQQPWTLWAYANEDGSELAPEERPEVRALRTRQVVRDQVVRLTRPDGAVRWIRVTAVPVFDDSGRPVQVVSSLVDLTERKEAEKERQQLARSEKLRALGQLASGVAHDLNQSLGIIAGYCDVITQALDRAPVELPEVRETLGMVAQAAMDGGETVKRLLMFARAHEEGERQRLDLGALLTDVARLTAPRWRDASQIEGQPIQVEVRVEGDLAIEGWPANLRAAFTNLVLNAVDAMPRGGLITLGARRVDPSPSSGQAAEIEVTVADNGVGMPPEVQARVFEPFFTTKGEKGTGLGLAMVFAIARQHAGDAAVSSEPGRGATFRLTLPAALGAPTWRREAEPPPTRPEQVAGLRILAVDDQQALAQMVADMLEPSGHRVTTCTSGEEALARLAEERFDVVVSDVGMGSGMNGFELAERIRARAPGTRIVLATGWGSVIEGEEAEQHGVDAVVAKPYRLAELRRAVEPEPAATS